MLRPLKNAKGFKIYATNEDKVGKLKDFYFDDEKWAIRYLVIDTDPSWLFDDLVLISPYSVSGIAWEKKEIFVNLESDRIRKAPSVDRAKPVSRRFEEKYSDYYGWPYYWTEGGKLWPGGIYPATYAASLLTGNIPGPPDLNRSATYPTNEQIRATHLQSMNEVLGYKVHAQDDTFGQVEDFVLEEESWALRDLLIETHRFLPSKSVLLATSMLTDIRWSEKAIFTGLTKDAIEQLPAFEKERLFEMGLESQNHI